MRRGLANSSFARNGGLRVKETGAGDIQAACDSPGGTGAVAGVRGVRQKGELGRSLAGTPDNGMRLAFRPVLG